MQLGETFSFRVQQAIAAPIRGCHATYYCCTTYFWQMIIGVVQKWRHFGLTQYARALSLRSVFVTFFCWPRSLSWVVLVVTFISDRHFSAFYSLPPITFCHILADPLPPNFASRYNFSIQGSEGDKGGHDWMTVPPGAQTLLYWL